MRTAVDKKRRTVVGVFHFSQWYLPNTKTKAANAMGITM